MEANIKCSKCGCGGVHKKGFTTSRNQRYFCKSCGNKFTAEPKLYSEETRQLAIKIYYSGVSGLGVGKVFDMHHNNVVRWIKKNERTVDKLAN